MLAAGELTPAGLKKLVSKVEVLTNIIYAVIARSGATRQSRFIRQIRTTRLLRFARKDGFKDFLRDHQVMAEAKMVVEKGLYKSMNYFVESAIKDEIEKNKMERIRAAIFEASKDPLVLSDIEEVERDFEYADPTRAVLRNA